MSMKYLSKQELQELTDKELDNYTTVLTQYQSNILDMMDVWVDNYNITSDEYDRRKAPQRIIMKNDSETLH